MTPVRPRQSGHYVLNVPGRGRGFWIAAAGGVLVGLFFLLFGGDKNMLQLARLYRERARLEALLTEQQQTNQKLEMQVQELQHNPKAVAGIARAELGMIRPEERVYRFVEEESPSKAQSGR